ncbi:hypothetical protein ABN09_09705 [Morganella morganii]|nr:hypothetical protein ABN09_09705 [Morganella morganii]
MSFFTISPESYKFRFIYFDGKGVIPFRQPDKQTICIIYSEILLMIFAETTVLESQSNAFQYCPEKNHQIKSPAGKILK